MANNAMFLVHRPSGLAIRLSKRMGGGWYVGVGGDRFAERLEKFLNAVEKTLPDDLAGLDDFALALEDVTEAPKCADFTYDKFQVVWLDDEQ